jgi:hypothetical protein
MRGHGRLSAGSTHLGTVCCVARRRGLRLRNGRQRGAPIRVVTALAFRAQAGAEALAFERLPWTTSWSPAQVRADACLPMESDTLGDDPV